MTQSRSTAAIPRIFIVAGPSATGKTTVARAIANRYGVPFVEGDDLHPESNIQKMSSGQPLNDNDRWGWLGKVCKTVLAVVKPPTTSHAQTAAPVCVASCSALKRAYRDFIREDLRSHTSQAGVIEGPELPEISPGVDLHFIYLTASEEELLKRTKERKGHYMKSDMVHSQLKSNEVPREPHDDDDGHKFKEDEDDAKDCIVVSTDKLSQEEVILCTVDIVDKMMADEYKQE